MEITVTNVITGCNETTRVKRGERMDRQENCQWTGLDKNNENSQIVSVIIIIRTAETR